MAASQAFEGIINQVVTSNLNFCLEQSPFSAVIHLKKTVIRNKSGTLLVPPPTLSVQLLQVQSDNYRQAQKIINLESIIKSLKSENLKSSNTIKELESELEREKFQVNAIKKEVSEEKEILDQEKEAIQSAQNRIETENIKLDHKVRELESKIKDLAEVGANENSLNEEKKVLRNKISDALEEVEAQNVDISDLKRSNKTQKSINIKLNKELSRLREKNQLEKNKVTKELKVEIKSWRKSLGIERSAKIKLEKKLKSVENLVPRQYQTKSTNTASCMSTSLLSTICPSTGTSASSNMASTCPSPPMFLSSRPTNLSSKTEASQSDRNSEMPYQITSPLPPIFNSQLRYKTKPVKFLSKSLPSLDAICWASPSDSEDDLDEMLSDMYDQEVKDFYTTERERLRAEHWTEMNNKKQSSQAPLYTRHTSDSVKGSTNVSDVHDETCSICTRPIRNYVPKYSSGLLWNPACSDCDTDENED